MLVKLNYHFTQQWIEWKLANEWMAAGQIGYNLYRQRAQYRNIANFQIRKRFVFERVQLVGYIMYKCIQVLVRSHKKCVYHLLVHVSREKAIMNNNNNKNDELTEKL